GPVLFSSAMTPHLDNDRAAGHPSCASEHVGAQTSGGESMSDREGGTSRRQLLQRAGMGAAALAVPGWLAGCGSGGQVKVDPTAGEWKRYAGTQLNFISENTAPTSAIAA